jgi:hypothetical protein
LETGLILPVPETERIVGDLRRRLDPNAAAGVPAHVTVLHPFRALERIDEATWIELGGIFARAPVFELGFARTGRFPGVLWLEPEPRGPIDALTRALADAFPDCPPYGGLYADPVPHLTVALGEDEAVLDRAERRLSRRLEVPIEARIASAALFARTPDGWREMRRFPLG